MTEDATFEALQLRVVIDENGNKFYYNHENQLHRKFGPAIECKIGANIWWINGKLHRTDGAAFIYSDGHKEWWINGEHLTKKEFFKHPLCTIK